MADPANAPTGDGPPAPGSADPPATPPEPPAVFHLQFAKDSAVWVGALGAVVGVLMIGSVLVLFVTAWGSLEGRLKVGLTLAFPVAFLGAAIVLAGLWMAIVEWRGRLSDEPAPASRDLPFDPVKVIEAVGQLRGAALAMVVGAILIFASSWIAQSAAGTVQPAPTSTTAPAQGSPAP
jgi:hypothetical protein